MDRKEILNSPPAKFLTPVYEIDLYTIPPASGLYHMYIQRVGLDHFLNISSSGLVWMYPQHP